MDIEIDQNIHRTEKPQITAETYKKNAFHPLRIESITEQLRQVSYAGYTNILEIGVGVGFLKHCLKLFSQISHQHLILTKNYTLIM